MILVSTNYTFTAAAKTITFLGSYASIELSQIKAIINTTDNIVIYQANNPSLGGVFVSPTITLTYNTAAMSNGDALMIVVDFTGQQTMALSEPVVIASNQSAIPVSGTITVTPSGTQDTNLKQVNGATVNVGVGAASTGTARVTTSTDSTIGTVTSVTAITNALPAGTNILGKIAIDQSTPGTTNLVALAANQSVNVAQINGVTPLMGTGNTGTGSPRVTIATDQAALTTAGLISVKVDQTTDGTTNKVRATGTQKPSYGSTVVMTVTNLQSMASSATAGWQSDRVSNISGLANDYHIFVKLTTANTAAANDKAMYVYVVPWFTTDGGSTWLATDQGTGTLPTGTEGTTTIASPNNLILPRVLNYTTTQMVVQGGFLLSNVCGQRIPDGWSLIIINFSGAALSTGCVVDYKPINDILV